MTVESSIKDDALHIKRSYPTTVSHVYAAWTNADFLSQWWGPPGSIVKEVELDFNIGGRYRIGIQQPNGDVLYVTGVYKEIDPDKKLVFTWRWENSEMDLGYSLVTLAFAQKGEETELTLTHKQLPSLEARIGHQEGWLGILTKLNDYIVETKNASTE